MSQVIEHNVQLTFRPETRLDDLKTFQMIMSAGEDPLGLHLLVLRTGRKVLVTGVP